MNLSDLQNLLRQAGWPDITVNSTSGSVPLIALMASIGLAESGGNPGARNTQGEDSVGLWQINRNAHRGYSVAQLQDPLFNAQVALQVYNMQGLRAWGVYTNGSYQTRGQINSSIALYSNQTSPPLVYANLDQIFDEGDVISTNARPAYESYDEYLAATRGDSTNAGGAVGSSAVWLFAGVLVLALVVGALD